MEELEEVEQRPVRKNEAKYDQRVRFVQKAIEVDEKTAVYTLNYFESGLWRHVEDLLEEEVFVGESIRVKRSYVITQTNHGHDNPSEKMFTFHTSVRDLNLRDENLRATIAIVHGFAENSDIHLESAIQYALNGFDVHLIDLRGYGLAGGYRMIHNRIHDFQFDVTALLKQVNPKLPLFLYGHSMGGLTVATYLLNNLDLNISGVILSAPLLNFSDSKPIPESKKIIVKALAPHMEVSFSSSSFHLGIPSEPRSSHSHDLQ